MRKYDHYEVASNREGEEGTFYNYRDALSLYMHIKQSSAYDKNTRATLWGVSDMGDFTCIMACGQNP